ncbi:MAG: EscU/YscU/HrcU family type III secretion system export apparatus switch protein [Kofleriaceae bacterium]
MDRPHPPSPRRRALARAAGRVLTSPAAVAALALGAGVVATIGVVASSAEAVAAVTRARLAHATDDGAVAGAGAALAAVPFQVLALAAPIVIAAAAGALLAQGALARGLWIPTRTLAGAPTVGAEPATAGQRTVEALLALGRAAILLAVAAAALVGRLPALASTAGGPGRALLGAAGATMATVAIAAVVLALVEIGWRAYRLRQALAMTTREWRDDARASGGDPHARRALRGARVDDRALVATARVVVLGDELAVALAWQPAARPTVARVGRDLAARRLVAAARAARVPLVADATLATALAAGAGAIADAQLPAVADLLAAVGVSPG